LADQIGRTGGPTIVVESRAGAGSVIGTEALARAKPDGNTLLINTAAIIVNSRLRTVNYHPLTDFEPICLLARSPNVIAVNSKAPYQTFAELLNAVRAKPGALTIASVGPASANHVAIEMLKRAANIDVSFVPYPGAAPAVNALLGEHVTSFFGAYANVATLLTAGKLRALVTASRGRIASLPDVPTIMESGYKDYEADLWFGLFAPAKTSRETVSQLGEMFTAALQSAEIKAKLVGQGFYPSGICGAEFGSFLRKQYDDYSRIIRDANIRAE
jgi:tripartite-type tricarboxylate transporter receptor subunit TctC